MSREDRSARLRVARANDLYLRELTAELAGRRRARVLPSWREVNEVAQRLRRPAVAVAVVGDDSHAA